MKENEILELITSEYSFEQVIYKIIAFEGMDPWDLDIKKLSDAFLQYLKKRREMDFRIPAKYIIIAAVLLKMKSEDLQQLYDLTFGSDLDVFEAEIESEVIQPETECEIQTHLNATLHVPPVRKPVRKIVVEELIDALRKALKTEERRKEKWERRRERIKIEQENITQRIEELYRRIDSLLTEIKKEIKFSSLVKQWERKEVVETFVPLIHLDHQKKIKCRQEEPFEEIFITKAGEKNAS
ncbi:MAG: hypothetical protein DRP13_00640 [Candidatus Aenigmatarchaeota archaeon]|nr:MAG: hypothetical protein DRP13_00640 [Candidatus Aenigmarchaeota archaeon]